MADNPPGMQRDALFADLTRALHGAMQSIVPRFLDTMPAAYFHDTDHATRVGHLQALIAAEASGFSQDLTLRSSDGRRVTFIREASYPGLLSELVERLPTAPPLSSAKVHTATDGRLVLDTFELGEPEAWDAGDPALAGLVEQTLDTLSRDHGLGAAELRPHLEGCSRDYLQRVPPRHMAQHYRLLQRMRASDLCEVSMEPAPVERLFRVSIACPSREGREFFARVAGYLGRLAADIRRGHVDLFHSEGETASVLTVLVDVPGELDARALVGDLARLHYLDRAVLSLWRDLPFLSLLESELLVALSRLAHQRLTGLNRLAFTRDRIEATIRAHPESACAIARRTLTRLSRGGRPEPGLPDLTDVRDGTAAAILQALGDLSGQVLRSNALMPQRRALVFRLPGEALPAPGQAPPSGPEQGASSGACSDAELPFGVFFVHGRDFDGVHVRFRDLARGGLRIVRPAGTEQFSLESERLYEEGYSLAWAQHLKNKDIPEGGAKGVILTAPGSAPEPAARAYVDALLDLIAPDPRTGQCLAADGASAEVLYLGPDENISAEMIDWIARRARQRGYPLPSAFISSKPGAGVNHKRYGVTSEGVTVFLDVALRHLGIDPRREPFTVKLTGGPDGDVAGNEIRILHREYGPNARIVGIADGSGCAEDPDGLDQGELLRLVEAERPVAEFDAARLGPRGRLTPIEADPGGAARNSMHSRVVSDAFVPAGGRPATLNDRNWQQFIGPDGVPASRLIVEGANLFLTPEARAGLSRSGVLIVKDSSANKCGVICSSLEILACMLLDEAGFLAIKEQFVEQVLERLRRLARLEAEALFRERRSSPHLDLPQLSERLSHTINRVTDVLVERIPDIRAGNPRVPVTLLGQHLPPVLLAEQPAERLAALPPQYVDRALACLLGGRIVYREGLALVERMPDPDLADLATRYLLQEYRTAQLADAVAASDLPDRVLIAGLLREGATAAALRLELDRDAARGDPPPGVRGTED